MNQAAGQFASDQTVLDGADNRVSAVTVFSDRAYVKRQAQARTKAGLNRICVELQAHEVDADSCQATVRGAGEILGVQFREVPVAKAPQADVRDLDRQIEDLRRRRQPLLDEQKSLDHQERFLNAVNALAETEIPRKMRTEFPSVENLTKTLEFLGGQFERIGGRNRELAEQLEEINKQLNALEQRRKAQAAPDRKQRKVIEVLFRTGEEQDVPVEAAYVVRRASWEPIYKIDVADDLGGVVLTMFAKIRQNTGEHWRDVGLAVSNVAPMAGADLPDLESWYLLPVPPPQPMAMAAPAGMRFQRRRSDSADMEDLAGEAVGAAAEIDELAEPEAAPFAEVEQRELPNAFEYALPDSAGIDAGSGETLLPLFVREVDGDFYHYAVPKIQPQAFLVCRAKADSDLMAGVLNVYMGGRFLGTTHLAEKRPGEPLRVNLGPDRGVKLRREQPADKAKEKFLGMESRKITRQFEYRIVAENLKDQPVRLELLEAVPVSKTDVYKVKDVELAPEPAEKDYDSREGVMRWVLRLEPGAVQEIHSRFTLTYPRRRPPVL